MARRVDPPGRRPPLDAEGETAEKARVERYLELLGGIETDESARTDEAVARAVLWSLHPIDDYGIYQATYRALAAFEPEVLVRAIMTELPVWLFQRGVHDSMGEALARLLWSEGGTQRLVEAAGHWDEAQRATVRAAAQEWAREDEAFEALVVARGGLPGTDPIEDWLRLGTVALAFRSGARGRGLARRTGLREQLRACARDHGARSRHALARRAEPAQPAARAQAQGDPRLRASARGPVGRAPGARPCGRRAGASCSGRRAPRAPRGARTRLTRARVAGSGARGRRVRRSALDQVAQRLARQRRQFSTKRLPAERAVARDVR